METNNHKVFLFSQTGHEFFRFGNNADGSFTSVEVAQSYIDKNRIKTLKVGVFNKVNGKYELVKSEN